ncbi:glycosyltransferase family 59 protein [Hypoxylon sp. NC1633]|nr:glycosyltransferase family 59 protein [Hypoxylon sp. NC1633]
MASWMGLDSSTILQLTRYGFVSMIVPVYTIRNAAPRYTSPIVFLCLASIGLLSRQWLSVVTKYAPEPYQDEVFHIPQAQVYCNGKYGVWDDKITTPPGLYVLTILANKLTGFPCSVYYLRLFNVEIISYLALAAVISRARLGQIMTIDPQAPLQNSIYAVWTGINIALFPLLFFFSGLYYTDIASTFVVLLAYNNHLGRVDRNKASLASDVYAIVLGLTALSMRQTNIFWAVVYLGMLEVIRGIKTLRPESVPTPVFTTLSQQIKFYVWRYSLGDIHDPPLTMAFPIDFVIMALSYIVAIVFNPKTTTRHVWPYFTVFFAFVGFVAWNGGVVLGDKANHVATVHLAQVLYVWPLFAFFSVPLLVPQLLKLAVLAYQSLTDSTTSTTSKVISSEDNLNRMTQPIQFGVLKPLVRPRPLHMTHYILILACTLIAAVIIVHFNTIIHPFTLADNRHYMFYIFRYTILRAWWIRYALIPVYFICGWLCLAALQGDSSAMSKDIQWIQTPFTTSNTPSPPPALRKLPANNTALAAETQSPSASTAVFLVFVTILSLVTTPLVEPRYFILPWVFWRLLVPAQPAQPALPSPEPLVSRWLVLGLETAWFLLINAATMYVFAARPFYWQTSDGELADGGRVQRFMW